MRLISFFIVFCVIALMLAFVALSGTYFVSKPGASAATASGARNEDIQSKAKVFDLSERDGFTSVGIMAAYEPNSHAFWWRPTPMIAQPSMLERYFERCKFLMDSDRLLNICVRGNEVVVSTTLDYARSLDQGLADAQSRLQASPGLLMTFRGPRDSGFNLQQKAGVDMNTPEGVPPTVVRSVKKTSAGWDLDVSCGCGNALISLNKDFDFIALKRN
jgi:hypothetical protein